MLKNSNFLGQFWGAWCVVMDLRVACAVSIVGRLAVCWLNDYTRAHPLIGMWSLFGWVFFVC